VKILKKRAIPRGISLRKAAKLLKVSRSTIYYKCKEESSENQRLMELIEEIYSKDPTIGFRRMKIQLERRIGKEINHKRVRRLMRNMGLRGISPIPRTTEPQREPYGNLLREMSPTCANQVWCADITYIKTKGGFVYGVAIMDLYSRKMLSFKLSNTLDESFCLEAVKEALREYGVPEVIHTDRGRQFTGKRFMNLFKEAGSKISVGELGFKDNIVMERFWRSYKWECVYLRDKMSMKELKEVSIKWFRYYNGERPHQSLNYRTPDEVYYACKIAG